MPPVGACIFHILIQFHQIVIVGNSGVAEQLTIEYIIPAAIGYRVSPVQVAVIFIIDFSFVVVLIVVVAVGGVKVVVVLSFIETDEEAAAVIGNLKSNWVNLTNKEKIEFLTRFIDSIKIYNDKGSVKVSEIKFLTKQSEKKPPQYTKLLK